MAGRTMLSFFERLYFKVFFCAFAYHSGYKLAGWSNFVLRAALGQGTVNAKISMVQGGRNEKE